MIKKLHPGKQMLTNLNKFFTFMDHFIMLSCIHNIVKYRAYHISRSDDSRQSRSNFTTADTLTEQTARKN